MIITTADYQSITGITLNVADTAYVNTLIPIVQNQIEVYCDRLFDLQQYLEWYKYSKYIVLRQYPVTNISFIGELDQVATFSNTTDYTYEITPTSLIVTDNSLTTTTITFGGAITTLTDIKTAIEAAIVGLTLTIASGYATISYKLLRIGTGREVYGAKRNDCNTKMVEDENRTLEILMDSAFQFWVQTDYACDTNVFIAYNAGYTSGTYPKSLQLVICNIIKDIMAVKSAGLTGLYQSEDITNYSYTLGSGVTGLIGQEMQKYLGDLEPFVKKVI